MMLGVVGKPSSGKTTFFNACTESAAKTAPYPFTTIEPNVGVTWVRVPCPHTEKGQPCSPSSGFCIEGNRFVPVKIIDVAGLVPGAHEGRGLGNKFLDDLRQADVLIHVVDVSGATDSEGNPVKPGEHDPAEDVEFLKEEIERWIEGIVRKAWEKVKKLPSGDREERLSEQFTGIGVSREQVAEIISSVGLPEGKYEEWAKEIAKTKPIIIAANKVDVDPGPENYRVLKEKYGDVFPVSAIAEYTLRRAMRAGFIKYVPGDGEFDVVGKLSDEQKRGLEYIKERVLDVFGGTGVQAVINHAVLDVAGNKVVFPVEDEAKWTDSEGNVLPDAVVLSANGTALDLAYAVHTDLGEKFIAAVDCRTGKRIGKDHVLEHLSVVKIVSGR